MARHIVLFHTYANFKDSTQKYHFQLKGWCYEESNSYRTKLKSTISRRLLSPFSGGSNDSIETFEKRTSGFLANPIKTRIKLSILGTVSSSALFDSIEEQNEFYKILQDKGELKNITTIQTTTLLDGSFCVDFVLGKEQIPGYIESDCTLQKLLLLHATFNDVIPTQKITSPLNGFISTPTDTISFESRPSADQNPLIAAAEPADIHVANIPIFPPDVDIAPIPTGSLTRGVNDNIEYKTKNLQKEIAPSDVKGSISYIALSENDQHLVSNAYNDSINYSFETFGFIPLIPEAGISLISDVDDTIKLSV